MVEIFEAEWKFMKIIWEKMSISVNEIVVRIKLQSHNWQTGTIITLNSQPLKKISAMLFIFLTPFAIVDAKDDKKNLSNKTISEYSSDRRGEVNIFELEKMHNENQKDIELIITIMRHYHYSRNKDKIFEYVMKLIELAPENRDIKTYSFGKVLNPIKHFKIKNAMMKKIEESPSNIDIILNLARYLVNDDPSLSEKLYKRVQRIDPENKTLIDDYSFFLKLHHRYEDAIKLLNLNGIDELPIRDKIEMWIRKAELNFVEKKYDSSRQLANAVIDNYDHNPSDGKFVHQAYTVLGKISFLEGRFGSAVKYAKHSLDVPIDLFSLLSFGQDISLIEMIAKQDKDEAIKLLELARTYVDRPHFSNRIVALGGVPKTDIIMKNKAIMQILYKNKLIK